MEETLTVILIAVLAITMICTVIWGMYTSYTGYELYKENQLYRRTNAGLQRRINELEEIKKIQQDTINKLKEAVFNE